MPHRAAPAPPSAPTRCPASDCDSHADPEGWRFKKKGFFHRAQRPHRVQRYLCQHCGRSFSSRTFSVGYWLRRPDLLEPLFHRLVSCSGLRQIAREMHVAHRTVQRLSERLGRHCLLFHETRRPQGVPREPLVLDGLQTFEHSQFWPFDLNLLVGPSHFVYGFNDAELRRSGTMRPAQRAQRARLERRHGRPDPQATRKAVRELVGRVVPPGASAVVRSDEHASYPRALRALRGRRIVHETTSSRLPRTTRNPLFPANHADLLLRHCSANHKRETIAFSKRRQGALYRAAIWTVWRNWVKARSENRRDAPPAVYLGLAIRALGVGEILDHRLLPDGILRRRSWLWRCYFGWIATRRIPNGRRHAARYAV